MCVQFITHGVRDETNQKKKNNRFVFTGIRGVYEFSVIGPPMMSIRTLILTGKRYAV